MFFHRPWSLERVINFRAQRWMPRWWSGRKETADGIDMQSEAGGFVPDHPDWEIMGHVRSHVKQPCRLSCPSESAHSIICRHRSCSDGIKLPDCDQIALNAACPASVFTKTTFRDGLDPFSLHTSNNLVVAIHPKPQCRQSYYLHVWRSIKKFTQQSTEER